MNTYGRNRQSIADIEKELFEIFACHEDSRSNDAGDPVIPANALVDVFRMFGERHDGVQVMTQSEEQQFINLVESNPGLEVTPQIILEFIAIKTNQSPGASPKGDTHDLDDRGRFDERDLPSGTMSRSSSGSSNDTTAQGNTPAPTKVPYMLNTQEASPFDSGRRQRSAPLSNNGAPSSWNSKRHVTTHRRRSDASSSGRALSDSESSTPGRISGRARAPSNPVSPRDTVSPPGSPLSGDWSFDFQPHTRTLSQGHYGMRNAPGYHYSRQNEFDRSGTMSPNSNQIDDSSFEYYRSSRNGGSSFVMPRAVNSTSDSEDDDDMNMGLVPDRSAASSLISLEPQERLEALQRTNADLTKKLMEAERSLQNRLAEHESELEEMQNRLEEAKSELSSTKREEKELRAKERQNGIQIATLESEIAKMQKGLDNARASYQSLQKQYTEQCAESENLRHRLRERDVELKDFTEQISLHHLEIAKWQQQRDQSENYAATLEAQLNIAREAQRQLDDQKQENLLLKETIDRMRFDMDELRTKADSQYAGSANSNATTQGSISKSLGLELMRVNKGNWMDLDESEEGSTADEETAVDEVDSGEADDTEGEDVIQTIITHKKRKVASRANKMQTIKIEDVKEYADAYTQHDINEFTSSHETQTDPEPRKLTSISGIQTDEVKVEFAAVQTEAEEPSSYVTREMEIQTDIPSFEPSRSPTPDEEMASSSSTVRPSTPKPLVQHKIDLPPSYSQVTEANEGEDNALDEEEMADALKKWHRGLHVPIGPIAGGISVDALEDWQALKDEIGVDCLAIDKVLEVSLKTGQPRVTRTSRQARKGSRFYNIYNTFVYKDESGGPLSLGSSLAPVLLFTIGLSALGVAIMTPAQQYSNPGAPTYYDRHAWSTFNSMSAVGEGFSSDGAAAIWNFIGRVGGGAARVTRGWPS